MRVRRTLIAAVAAAAVAIALSGCAAQVEKFNEAMASTSTPTPPPAPAADVNQLDRSIGTAPETTVFEQKLPGGRTVLCVSTTGYHGDVSLSCDWPHVDSPPIKAAG